MSMPSMQKLPTASKPAISVHRPVTKPVSEPRSGSRGKFIIILGQAGMGKTSLAAQFPDPMFICDETDDGLLDLIDNGQVPEIPSTVAATWTEFIAETKNALQRKPGSVVFDSLSGIQQLAFKACCKIDYGNDFTDKGFLSFGKGPDTVIKGDDYLPKWLSLLREFRNQGTNVILTGHTRTKTYDNPHGGNYDREIPDLHEKVWSLISRSAENILFLTVHVPVRDSKPNQKTKVSGDTIRVLRCTSSPVYPEAKNRLNIRDEILLSEEGDNPSQDTYLKFCKSGKLNPLTCRKL